MNQNKTNKYDPQEIKKKSLVHKLEKHWEHFGDSDTLGRNSTVN